MSKAREKVEVQKGPVRINEPTYRWETYGERQISRAKEVEGVKRGQTMEYYEPKK